jgi:hypothetical protein
LGSFFTKVFAGIVREFTQKLSGVLFGGKLFASSGTVEFEASVTFTQDFRGNFSEFLSNSVVFAVDEAFDKTCFPGSSPIGVCESDRPKEAIASFNISYNGASSTVSLCVGNHKGLPSLHYSNAGVRCSSINSNYFCDDAPLLKFSCYEFELAKNKQE